MGRAMKTFYNPVRRSTRDSSDPSSSQQAENKNQPRLHGPYLASTPWRRNTGPRPPLPAPALDDPTPSVAPRTPPTAPSPDVEAEVGTATEVASEVFDEPKRYIEEPFDLDADCDDAIEEYFLTPLQVAQRAYDAAQATYATLQRAAPDFQSGQSDPRQSLIAEQRNASSQLDAARLELLQAEQDRTSLANVGFVPPRSRTSAQLEFDSFSSSLLSLASAPRLSHRQPPTGLVDNHQFLRGSPYRSRVLSSSSLTNGGDQATLSPFTYTVPSASEVMDWGILDF